jgi:transcriptional regulator with XRE-family HTH domain
MPNKPEETKFTRMVRQKMDEHGYTANEMAQKLNFTYEHMRRILNGRGFPAVPHTLRQMCKILDLPYDEALEAMREEKIKKLDKKLGVKPPHISS